jgi:plasmid stability protein
MADTKRATIYFDPEVHKGLRLKAAAMDRSVSDLVNEVARLSLLEDAEDLEAFDDRASEPEVDYDSFVKSLKRRGKI